MVPLQSVAAGLLGLLLVVLVGVVVLGLVLPSVPARAVAGVGRVLQAVRRPADVPRPLGPPLERLAADLRRIRHDLDTAPEDQPVARRVGVLQAYDDVLTEACAALDLPDTLHGLPLGPERDAERLRVEYLLEQRGLVIRPQ